ncbi:MAG: DUF547 domain-containing protein [Leptolyngbyaceae cyanobacterium bins.349]|nr:DUF547 domain-containing protein [Leptolyngbyaceae cyanobacterium bins.349]
MIDFLVWNQLLQHYVDDQGRVDYATWKSSSLNDLMQWLQVVSQDADTGFVNDHGFGTESRDRPATNDQLAFWLNLYNALTIAQVLQRYPIPSIQPKIWGLPNWLAFWRFFTRSVYQLHHQPLSLNAIEHGILRQQFREPRIHFALVCASIGCPLLRNEAYFPERVQAQLEADASRFINNPDKVRYDASANILYCSKIFKWYQKDFLNVSPSIPAYIQSYYLSNAEFDVNAVIKYLPYSWQLNQRTSS